MDRLRQLIGILTLVAAVALGAWFFRLLADDDKSGLFVVRLEFRDVRGLKSGADVRYRGVRVGTVSDVAIGLDGEKGVITVLLQSDGSRLARQSSRFWIVVPRFGGLTSGATGLDTLVRDAYVAFLTTDINSPELSAGSLVAGLERPPTDRNISDLDPLQRGDLLMSVLVPENSGIEPGAAVQFRGMRVGEVRQVELAQGGTHVEMSLRIRERYRSTVTDKTEFWIARPRVSGALLRGISVEDVGALLTPFVGYHTLTGKGVPVPDGYRVIATQERPDTTANDIPDGARTQPATTTPMPTAKGLRIVEIAYECTDEDWLSPDDVGHRRGSGLMFVDGQDRVVVLTARSLCDGRCFMSDLIGGPDIKNEAIRVVVPGIGVYRAGRTWIDPAGSDLALLVMEDVPPDLPTTPVGDLDFDSGIDVANEFSIATNEHANALGTALPALGAARGGVLIHAGRAVGVIGCAPGEDGTPARIPLSALPAELRPKS